MSLKFASLAKVLKVLYLNKKDRNAILKDDVRKAIQKEKGFKVASGGDFYVPFWSDAKKFVAGTLDLEAATADRIASDKIHKSRLYPIIKDSFIGWWKEKRRLINVPIKVIDERLTASYVVEGYGAVKIENTLSLIVGDDGRRLIYPYFAEKPQLSEEGARMALSILSESVKNYSIDEFRVLDVVRGKSFSSEDVGLMISDTKLFDEMYSEMMREWNKLKNQSEG